jgi:hypothetical protein
LLQEGFQEKVAEKEGIQEYNEVAVPPRKKCKVETHDITFMTPSRSVDIVYSKKSVRTSEERDVKSATKDKGRTSSLILVVLHFSCLSWNGTSGTSLISGFGCIFWFSTIFIF